MSTDLKDTTLTTATPGTLLSHQTCPLQMLENQSETVQSETVQSETVQSETSHAETKVTDTQTRAQCPTNAQTHTAVEPRGFGGAPNLAVPALSLQDWHQAEQHNEPTAITAAKQDFLTKIDDALARYGFLAITDHGIKQETIARAFDVAKDFFKLTQAEKMQLHQPGTAGHRGYTPDGETAKGAKAPDLKEFVQLGASNNPAPERLPDFLPALQTLMADLSVVGRTLLRAIALHQVGKEDYFDCVIDPEASILRALHYPPLPEEVPAFSERAAAHEDINLITLLLSGKATTDQSNASGQGLQLWVPKAGKRAESAKAEDFHWVNAIVPEGALIINIGEMLENWTNGAWRATTHRVINPPVDDPERKAGRISMPFFVHPKGEFSLKPHPQSIARAGGIQHYPDISAGVALKKRLRELGLLKD